MRMPFFHESALDSTKAVQDRPDVWLSGKMCVLASRDICEGGIFAQTMNPFPAGSQVRLNIRFEADPTLYLAVGFVRHSLS